MKKINFFALFCGIICLMTISANSYAKTPGEKLDHAIDSTKDGFNNAKDNAKDKYDSTKEKVKDKYNDCLENAKTK
jgi:hypothetical protein